MLLPYRYSLKKQRIITPENGVSKCIERQYGHLKFILFRIMHDQYGKVFDTTQRITFCVSFTNTFFPSSFLSLNGTQFSYSIKLISSKYCLITFFLLYSVFAKVFSVLWSLKRFMQISFETHHNVLFLLVGYPPYKGSPPRRRFLF